MTKLQDLPLPDFFKAYYSKFPLLTPVQEKALQAGLLDGKSLLVCAPTASGKTLIATMAICQKLNGDNTNNNNNNNNNNSNNDEKHQDTLGKAIYLVPLKALANEKFKEYKELFNGTRYKVIISTGEVDSESNYLANYDLLILTTEKLDSLLRHRVSWLSEVETVIVDEIHLLNDPSRGPTLEVILTLLRMLIKPQLIGLSATIGNPQELANWLEAALVEDHWRPVELKKGIHWQGETEFFSGH